MQVIVKRAFRDKYTGDIHSVGDKLTVSKKRFEEITQKGDFVEAVKKTNNKEN